jgi:NO-binding membrane sensor protein with MHYT domain
VVVAFGLLYAMRLRSAAALLGVAVLYAAAIVGMHYLALSGLSIRLDPAMPQPGGQDLFTVFIPVFAIGVMSLAVPITAVLVAPDRAGRLQPEPRKPRQRGPRPQRSSGPRRRQPVG